MTDRFPLIVDPSTQRVKELASGDNLDLTGSGIVADVFTVDTNSEERLRIDSSGKLGLGISSPQYLFHARGGSGTAYRNLAWFQGAGTHATAGFERAVALGASNDGAHVDGWNGTSGSRGDTPLLLQSAGGKVAIGTMTPSTILHIEKDTSDGTVGIYPEIRLDNDNVFGRSEITFYGGATKKYGIFCYNGDGDLRFNNSIGETARMDASGRLLVGTSSPISDALLQIQGDAVSSLHAGSIFLRRGEASTSITSGEPLGQVYFTDNGGAQFGAILCEADGTSGGVNGNPGRFVFKTEELGSDSGPKEWMRIDSSGRLGLGTSNIPYKFVVSNGGAAGLEVSPNQGHGAGAFLQSFNRSTNSFLPLTYYGNAHVFETGTGVSSDERMRIDSSGNVGIGLTSPSSKAHVKGGSLTVEHASPLTGTGQFNINCENNSQVSLSYDDQGHISIGTASTPWNQGGFSEKVRITSSGRVSMPDTGGYTSVTGHTFENYGLAQHVTQNDTCLLLNRQAADGTLIQFRHASATEGTIEVNGTTVSLVGGHLSRWSQLPGGAERTEILRGSVLSNIDEMCEWSYEAKPAVLWEEGDCMPEGVSAGDIRIAAQEAGTENNEQLNRMKVSDVEGDKNVSGVFQSWDDDDDIYTNDFYCAMTGDFVIRIAQGTTVTRGDLLMSAGDGTAKPQDDDIVRSKTIAKVTSTTVSETYSDGSYCVPCVLMAC